MRTEDFIKEGLVVKVTPDTHKADSLLITAENSLLSAKRLPLDEHTASSALCLAYDAMRAVLESIALRKGYRIYSHEAYTYFLKEHKMEREASVFDKYRKLRNGIQYYGKIASVMVAKAAIEEIEQLIQEFKEKSYLKNSK